MTTIKAIRLASLVTAINVLVASGFSIAAIIRPQYLVPAESVPTEASLLLAMYAAAPRIPLALLVLGAICGQRLRRCWVSFRKKEALARNGIDDFEYDVSERSRWDEPKKGTQGTPMAPERIRESQ